MKIINYCAGVILFAALGGPSCLAGEEPPPFYSNSDLKGAWLFSGLLRFGAPVPILATLVDGAPPHALVNPGDVVGVWATILGSMRFDGDGEVSGVEDVVKTGELVPLPPVPFPSLPPFPEIGAGSYSVSENGVVKIDITGRDPSHPEGQVDFETGYYCLLNRTPREMKCTFSYFRTYFVDPAGYNAPITGEITFKQRH